jgi:hypothetical protein
MDSPFLDTPEIWGEGFRMDVIRILEVMGVGECDEDQSGL